jgi:hypothetical protein
MMVNLRFAHRGLDYPIEIEKRKNPIIKTDQWIIGI